MFAESLPPHPLTWHWTVFAEPSWGFAPAPLRWLTNSFGTICYHHQKVSTRIHPKYVDKNSPKKRNYHGQKMSARIHQKCPRVFTLWKCPLEFVHFEKKCPREFTVRENSPSPFLKLIMNDRILGKSKLLKLFAICQLNSIANLDDWFVKCGLDWR